MVNDFLNKDDEPDALDPTVLSVEEQKAFYGSIFAMAAADDTVESEEIELIFETLDLKSLDDEDRREVHGYLLDPPDFSECLEELRDADRALRYGLMLNLVELMVADDLIHEREEEHISEAQEKLDVADEQLSKMKDYAQEVERITERGIDDEHAANSLKDTSSDLVDAGVPSESVAMSSSVGVLSAAGIGKGWWAMILGLGVAPAVAGPFGIYYLLKTLLGIDNEERKEERRRRRERKTQMAIQNLQETISTLVDQLEVLQEDAAKAEANQEAVEKLNERLRKLKQVLKQREEQSASA